MDSSTSADATTNEATKEPESAANRFAQVMVALILVAGVLWFGYTGLTYESPYKRTMPDGLVLELHTAGIDAFSISSCQAVDLTDIDPATTLWTCTDIPGSNYKVLATQVGDVFTINNK